MDKEVEKEMKGIKEFAKLTPEERKRVCSRLRENGASEKAIRTVDQLVEARNEIARWFKRGGNKDESRR
nr:MAG TPA: hypothetical protein [Caudoviricetes sp.]